MDGVLRKGITVFDGEDLRSAVSAYEYDEASIFLSGNTPDGRHGFVPLTSGIMSKHIMVLGGIGTGKTTALNQIVRQIFECAGENDVIIIFDTKGDFRDRFVRRGEDVIISNGSDACGMDGTPDYWNLFNEIDRCGNEKHMYSSTLEICKTIFQQRLEHTNQIFFPSAAKDLLLALITYIIRVRPPEEQNNATLREYIMTFGLKQMYDLLGESSMEDMVSMRSYISSNAATQAAGVMSELRSVCAETLMENFAMPGTLSMSELVRRKGGRAVFIEYDIKTGSALQPVYKLLFDLALKQALARNRSEGNVWMIADEFSLLPQLMHIEDAVNFGRSLGVKMIVGIQNIEQVYDAYGETRARSLISGFSSKIVMRLSDPASRSYIVDCCGANIKQMRYMSAMTQNGLREELRDGNVVEDWDIMRLGTGDSIILLPGIEPFRFHFDYMK